MLPVYEDFLERLETLLNDLEKTIINAPTDALAWQPGEDMNALNVLVTHTCGALEYWIGDMGIGDAHRRVRSEEFDAPLSTEDDLRERIEQCRTYARQVFSQLTMDDLTKTYPTHDGKSFRVAWSIFHALEHTATHVGHAQVTRQLWDQRKIES